MHVLPDANSILDGHIVADRYSALNKGVIADVAMRADHDVFQHMSERPDARTLPDRICFNQRSLVDEWRFFHFDISLTSELITLS